MKKKDKVNSWPVEAKAGLALVLTSAVIVGGALIIGTNVSNKEDNISGVGVITSNDIGSIEDPSNIINSEVDSKVELLTKPFTVDATCKRYFYDMNDDSSIRSQAIVPVPNKPSSYMKSVGVDYIYGGQVFDVVASTSGVVSEKINDSTYGNMLIIKHESGLETIYASLGTTLVNEGDEVKQGDLIGTSGESLYTAGLGSCLHFEIIKDNTYLNPEKSYSQEVAKL